MGKLWRRTEEVTEGGPDRNLLSSLPEAPVRDPRLAAYVDRVCDRLPRSVPPESRQELRAELVAHLEALVDAHLEVGSDEDTAVKAALHQFGNANSLGRQWSRAWKRSRPLREPLWALGFTAALFLYRVSAGSALALLTAGQVGSGPLVARLGGPFLTLFLGYRWAHLREADGSRPVAGVVLAGLLAAVLLPMSPDLRSSGPLFLYAVLSRPLTWSMVRCSAAGLTSTLRVLHDRLERAGNWIEREDPRRPPAAADWKHLDGGLSAARSFSRRDRRISSVPRLFPGG